MKEADDCELSKLIPGSSSINPPPSMAWKTIKLFKVNWNCNETNKKLIQGSYQWDASCHPFFQKPWWFIKIAIQFWPFLEIRINMVRSDCICPKNKTTTAKKETIAVRLWDTIARRKKCKSCKIPYLWFNISSPFWIRILWKSVNSHAR